MAKLFYDHLIMLDEVLLEVAALDVDQTARQTIIKAIDEITNYRVIIYILDILPSDYHEEFLLRLRSAPADVAHIKFIESKLERDISADLIALGEKIKKELLTEIKKYQK